MAKSIISAQSLVKRYGTKNVVDDIRFEVIEGECYGLLGPNGAGKTSTMRMIYCSTLPSAGELRVDGLSVVEDAGQVKAKLGVVPQMDGLDPSFSVYENLIVFSRYLKMSKIYAKERADHVIAEMGLGEHRNKKVEELSGGLKRRLSIARALLNDPSVLILDEPTTGLDPQARLWIWELLSKLKKKGKTLVLTTHYMEEAEKLCDRLVIMDNGKLLIEGSPKKLIEDLVGHEVIETQVEEADLNKTLKYLEGKFEYQKINDHIRVFIRSGQDGKQLLESMAGEKILIRRATLDDVFLKVSGYELRD